MPCGDLRNLSTGDIIDVTSGRGVGLAIFEVGFRRQMQHNIRPEFVKYPFKRHVVPDIKICKPRFIDIFVRGENLVIPIVEKWIDGVAKHAAAPRDQYSLILSVHLRQLPVLTP